MHPRPPTDVNAYENMETDPDRRVAHLASKQHGVFSRAQAKNAGLTDSAIRNRVSAGRWQCLHRGVYRIEGAPTGWLPSLAAAWMAWGPWAVVSHLAAAALYELVGFEPGPLELIVPRGCATRRLLPGVVTHRPSVVVRGDVARRGMFLITAPVRTLFDLASVVDRDRLEDAFDDAVRRGLVSARHMRQRLHELDGRGRRGVANLRRIVDDRSQHRRVPQSVFETRTMRAFRAAGLPKAVLQHPIRDRGRLVAIVDFAFPDQRIAIEADGYRWHAGRRRWEHDLARRNTLTSLGWHVLHLTWNDVSTRPEETAAIVAALLRTPQA